jgi:hypothetical protein
MTLFARRLRHFEGEKQAEQAPHVHPTGFFPLSKWVDEEQRDEIVENCSRVSSEREAKNRNWIALREHAARRTYYFSNLPEHLTIQQFAASRLFAGELGWKAISRRAKANSFFT